MWGVLLRLLKLETSQDRGAYRAYTTKFDRVIGGNQINQFLANKGRKAFEEYASELDLAWDRWIAGAELAAIEAVAGLKDSVADRTIACLLVDHSGSMRGQRAILATAIVEIVADFWSRLGVRYEILGFTTQSWHGGRSRRRWRLLGSPPNPGRLCDLLHIVYRSADDTVPGAPWTVRNLNRRELLKENVDGEAVEWATSRLLARPEDRKILIVISDGAPVDDSTLMANDVGYLHRHLVSVVEATQAKGIRLGAIGTGEFVEGIYPRHILLDAPQQLSSLLIPFVVEMSSLSE